MDRTFKKNKKSNPNVKTRKNQTLLGSKKYTKNKKHNAIYHNYTYPFLDILLLNIK